MKVLAIERDTPGAAVDQFAPLLKPEAIKVWELYQAGTIREMYFDRDRHAAVLMLECETVEAARQVLDALPLVKAGLIVFEIMPLVAYSGFARLFAGEGRPGRVKGSKNETASI